MSRLSELFFENTQAILEDEVIVLLPVSRLAVDYRFKVYDEYWLFPPEDEILLELQHWVENTNSNAVRQLARETTNIDFKTIVGNSIIAYKTVFPREKLEGEGHQVDIDIILELAREAEFVFDVLKFYEGKINVPEYLPGRVGSMDLQAFDASIIIDPKTKSYNLVVGQAYTHAIKKGIGFRFDESGISRFAWPEALVMVKVGTGDVCNIAKLGLSHFSRILEANTPTEKFILCMNLFEFLASPGKFENFQEAKKSILIHLCNNRAKYHELSERFKELSGKKDDEGKEVGYRTRIVHMGDRLEDFLNPDQIRRLLVELQNYLRVVIYDLLRNTDWDWVQMVEYRKDRKIAIGIAPSTIY